MNKTIWDRIKYAAAIRENSYETSNNFDILIHENFETISRFIDAVLAADTIDLHTSDSEEQRIMKERVDAAREVIAYAKIYFKLPSDEVGNLNQLWTSRYDAVREKLQKYDAATQGVDCD